MSENNPRGGYDDAANAANELSYKNERLQSENAALRSMLERMAKGMEERSKIDCGCEDCMNTNDSMDALAEYQAWKEGQK